MQIWRASAVTLCGSLPSIVKYCAQSIWPEARRSENWMHRRGSAASASTLYSRMRKPCSATSAS